VASAAGAASRRASTARPLAPASLFAHRYVSRCNHAAQARPELRREVNLGGRHSVGRHPGLESGDVTARWSQQLSAEEREAQRPPRSSRWPHPDEVLQRLRRCPVKRGRVAWDAPYELTSASCHTRTCY
jgi:hypothetical protein